MDLLRAKAGRQRRIGEVDRFRFLAYEQNPRHFMVSVLIASRNSYRVRATLASPAAAQQRNNPSDTRFVCRATLAAMVRGPARHPSHPCLNPKAGPCSDNRAPHAAAGIDRSMTAHKI